MNVADLSKYDEIIIWGASMPPEENDVPTSHGRAIERLIEILRKKGILNRVIFIVDSNKEFIGKKRLGYSIKSPDEILGYPNALLIVNTISICAIQNALKRLEIKNDYVVIPYYLYHGTVDHPYMNEVAREDMLQHKEDIANLYWMEDEATKRYMDIIMELRLRGEDDLYTSDFYKNTGGGINYFCDTQLAPKGNVTYIDVGAFDGDSIEPVRKYYGSRLKKCIAFEPNAELFAKLKKYISDHAMEDISTVLPYALGDEEKIVCFSSQGAMGQVSEAGEIAIEQKMFDNLQVESVGDAMVKMDIEGFELSALKGMQEFIRTHKPYLAICIYHKEKDLYEIAQYIKSLNADYRLYIRGGWHLECWAVPESHFI